MQRHGSLAFCHPHWQHCLNALQEFKKKLRDEYNEIEHVELMAKAADLVGRTFRYRNRYSDSEEWFMYSKVTGMKDGRIFVTSFQTDCLGNLDIKTREDYHPQTSILGDEIPLAKFEAELELFKERVIGACNV